MPDIVAGHIDQPESLQPVFEEVAAWNPGFRMGVGRLDGQEALLTSERVRHIWLADGEGSVFLPRGYATREGDGRPLPETYETAPLDETMREALHILAACRESFHEKIQTPVAGILARQRAEKYTGDIAGEIWLILESGVEREAWTRDTAALNALIRVMEACREIGWSVKQTDSYETIRAGDQLTITPDRPARVKGTFRYWWIETDAQESEVTTTRRLYYLKDTAGGCNFAFDAFRRLPLTWQPFSGTPERPDGVNRVNSHVVNIASETSKTHYHPATPIGGGRAQSEMYLVLDPGAYRLKTYGRRAHIHTFPDINDLTVYRETPLTPGSTLYIQPDTGHRGVDVFVNVLTLPGFKPRNEIYIDQRIREETGGQSPFNPYVTTG